MRRRIAFPKDAEAITLGHQQDLDGLLIAIKEQFDSDCILYVEGSPAPDVLSFLESARIQPDVDVEPGTSWPKQKVFHIRVTPANIDRLLDLTSNHAEPEVCDHLVVYRDEEFLLWAHDAFDGYVYANPSLGTEKLERLHAVVMKSAPRSKVSSNRRMFIESQLMVAARTLRDQYGELVSEVGGSLDVRIERASNLRSRVKTVGLIADVTWEGARIHDHRHADVLVRNWFSSEWQPLMHVSASVALIEEQIREWIDAPPIAGAET